MTRAKCISGKLQIGEGKPSCLFHVTATNPDGDTSKVDLLLSADFRHVWLTLDRNSARDLANLLIRAVKDDDPERE